MRKIKFSENKFYHLYNRGVDKRLIFVSEEDYSRFEAYLYLLNDIDSPRVSNLFAKRKKASVYDNARNDRLVAIGAYCLMPNHFHMLLSPLIEGGVSKFMQKLQTAYTMYFNNKRDRRGSLFESTFRASTIARDQDLKYAVTYIHLNPAKLFDSNWKELQGYEFESVASKALQYRYSSIGEFAANKFVITSPDEYPMFVKRINSLDSHIQNWLKYSPRSNID
ncbi:transposase [Candidatus Kaiserbacteria bacterium]|nr:transposase [Candidatus Kaiserbacteria bacterium]